MRLNLSRKILIIAVVLFLVTITSSYVTYQYINRVSKNSIRVLNVELPLEESFLKMEIGLSETTRTVLDYIQDYQEKHLYVLLNAKNNFETSINFCPNCGVKLSGLGKFCALCGSEIK